MSFSQWFFSFRGRIGRGRWWISILVSTVALYLVFTIAFVVLKITKTDGSAAAIPAYIIFLFGISAATVKRLHDRGRSAWRYLIAVAIIVIAAATAGLSGNTALGFLASAVGFIGFVYAVVDLGMLAGEDGQNRFGSDPRTTEEGAMTAGQYLFSFRGRVGRGRWWFGHLLLIPYCLVAALSLLPFFAILGGIAGVPGETSSQFASATGSLGALAYLYSYLTISVKRCHDRGLSGWLMLLSFIPFANIWVFIELAFLKGNQGPNRFGPDPQPMIGQPSPGGQIPERVA